MRWCDVAAAAGILRDLARILTTRSDDTAAARAERLHNRAIELHTERRRILSEQRSKRQRNRRR